MIEHLLISIGLSYFDHPSSSERPWWWHQPRYEHTESVRSPQWGVGFDLVDDGRRFEIVYRDLGKYSGFLAWQEPERVKDDPATECIEPCTKTIWGYNVGTVRGIELIWAPDRQGFSELVGLFAFRSEWYHYRSDVNDDHARNFGGPRVRSTQYGIAPVFGARWRSGNISLDARLYPDVGSDDVCCSPWRRIAAITLTLRGK